MWGDGRRDGGCHEDGDPSFLAIIEPGYGMYTLPVSASATGSTREDISPLRDNATDLAGIASRLGFASQSHFCEVFRRATGLTPNAYRRARS
jgi:AraC-like DNA-binding protein